MSLSGKRGRGVAVATEAGSAPDSAASVPVPADAARAALRARCGNDSPAGAWQAAAAAAGVSGPDAFLCHLGRSVCAALESVPASAEAARSELRALCTGPHPAVDPRLCELEGRINDAESIKVAALERELCAVDAALERLRDARAEATRAADSLGDDELLRLHATLTDGLDASDAKLLALPTGVVEPAHVGFVADQPALLAGGAVIGRVVSPRAVTAADLSLAHTPKTVRPRQEFLRLRLELTSAAHATQHNDELELSLGAAASAMLVTVALPPTAGVAAPARLAAVVASGMEVDIPLPGDLTHGATICIGPCTVYGQALASLAVPARVPVRLSMLAPLRVRLRSPRRRIRGTSMGISAGGLLYAAQDGRDDLSVFDPAGARLGAIADVDHCFGVSCYEEPRGPGAIVACSPERKVLVSVNIADVDLRERTTRWSEDYMASRGWAGSRPDVGIACLPRCGVFMVAFPWMRLGAFSIVGGVELGAVNSDSLGIDIAVDRESAAIFCSEYSTSDCTYGVVRYSFSLKPPAFRAEGHVLAAGRRPGDGQSGGRPLAVVPPAPGKHRSYLVVGTLDTSELLVLTLPSLRLRHTHSLKGMTVAGLTADPWGTVLAVRDARSNARSSCIHVLAWPLPGMGKLE